MHVSRVLKELENDGLISRNRRMIEVIDWEMLTSVGDFTPRYPQMPDDQSTGS